MRQEYPGRRGAAVRDRAATALGKRGPVGEPKTAPGNGDCGSSAASCTTHQGATRRIIDGRS